MFVSFPIENVPIERVTQNLERRANENSRDIETLINLGRVHAMAYALKSETTPVRKPLRPDDSPSNDPEFGVFTSQFAGVRVKPAADAAETNQARQHLTKAIASYEAAIALDPSNLVARIGRAWCLDQSGDRTRALAAYRDIMKDAWTKEGSGNLPGLQNFMPVTQEVGQYLIALLDPAKDAAEIAEIRSRIARVQRDMRTRPITPIIIPLGGNPEVSDLARRSTIVRFDADGSGVERPWSWVSDEAGILIFDKLSQKHPASGLDWFGNVTFFLFWENGYRALDALDDNGDGTISGKELERLSIWQDKNQNGIADPMEVRSLAEWHINELSCRFEWSEDDPDVAAWSPAGARFEDGAVRPTFDLLLYPR